MKMGLKTAALLPICLTFMLSCKKSESGSNSPAADCISEGTVSAQSLAPPLTQAQLDVIDALFQQNNLSTANQQFFYVDGNYIDTNQYLPPGGNADVDQVMILSYRWYNNLPVFRWNDNYTFYNGVLQPSLIYTGPAPGPNTTFRQTLSSVRTIWLNNYMKVATYGPLNNKPTYPNAAWRDSCLTATPGYLDAAFFDSTIAWQTQLVKAWQVAPTGQPYPMIYVEDSTAAAWPSDVFIP
jgi:hypothetical protein